MRKINPIVEKLEWFSYNPNMAENIQRIPWYSGSPFPALIALEDEAKAYPANQIDPRVPGELMGPGFAIWHTYPLTTTEAFVSEGTRFSYFPDQTHRQTVFIPGAQVTPEIASVADQHLWLFLDVGIGPLSQGSAKMETRVLSELQGQDRTAIACLQALRGRESGSRHYALFAAYPVTPWRQTFPPPDDVPSLEVEFAIQQLRRNRTGEAGPEYYHNGRTIPPGPVYQPDFFTRSRFLGRAALELELAVRGPLNWVRSVIDRAYLGSRFGRRD